MKRYKRDEEDWLNNLREFLKEDVVYQKYLTDETFEPNDFEQYGIDHCLDIQAAIDKIIALRKRDWDLTNRNKKKGIDINE